MASDGKDHPIRDRVFSGGENGGAGRRAAVAPGERAL